MLISWTKRRFRPRKNGCMTFIYKVQCPPCPRLTPMFVYPCGLCKSDNVGSHFGPENSARITAACAAQQCRSNMATGACRIPDLPRLAGADATPSELFSYWGAFGRDGSLFALGCSRRGEQPCRCCCFCPPMLRFAPLHPDISVKRWFERHTH